MADKLTQLTSPNQTDQISPFAALQGMLDRGKYTTDGMIPATVISYDRVKNLATIKPVIHFVSLDDKPVERQELVEIPVLALGGGGFVLNFPLKQGDLGWIFAGDRELSTFLEELKAAAPSHGRAKSFADGLFIPDIFRQYTIGDGDANAVVLQSLDGSVKVSLSPSEINIVAPSAVKITTPTTEISNDLIVNGKSTFKGGVEADSGTTVTLPAGTTIGDIDVTDHGHTQQNSGSGRTAGGMTS